MLYFYAIFFVLNLGLGIVNLNGKEWWNFLIGVIDLVIAGCDLIWFLQAANIII